MTVFEKYFLAFCVFVIVVFSAVLYFDFNRRLDSNKGEVVGSLTFRRNNVQRKYATQVVWDDLTGTAEEKTVPVYNRDTIRTAEISEALITLNDQTSIRLDADTMIILSLSKDAVNINYAYGSIQAVRKTASSAGAAASEPLAEIYIVTKDNKEITVKDTDIKLAQAKGDDRVNITVSRGEAEIKVDGNEQATLKQDQLAVLSSGGMEVKPLNLKTFEPSDSKHLFAEKQQLKVSFEFARPENASEVVLEIGDSSDLSRLRSYNVANKSSIERSLKPGIYYWRIRARNRSSKNIEYSEIKKFTILEKEKIRILSPASRERYEYSDAEPVINFAWTRTRHTQTYELEISKSRDFSDVAKYESLTTSIGVALGAGEYFYRIKNRSKLLNASTVSPVGTFKVVKKETISSPVAITPKNGKRILQAFFEVGGVTFNWNKNREIRKTEFWLSSSPDFNEKTVKVVPAGFLVFQEKLATGHYFWKLRGLSGDNRALTDFSQVSDFHVIENEKLRVLSPDSEKTFDLYAAQETGIQFSWRKAALPGLYRLNISRKKNMSDPDVSQKIKLPSARIKTLKPGEYYWNVSLISEKNQEITSSPISKFKILDYIDQPLAIYPQDKSIVDMSDQNTLGFKWNELPEVEAYEIKLFQFVSGKRTKIFTLKTRANRYEFRDLEKLDRGRFLWTVQAFRKQGRKATKSLVSETEFFITIEKLDKPKLNISNEKFIF